MEWTSKKLPVRDPNKFNHCVPVAYTPLKDIFDEFREWASTEQDVIFAGKNKNIPTEKEMKKMLEKWHKERYPSDKEWIQNDKPYPFSQNGSYKNPRFNLRLKKTN